MKISKINLLIISIKKAIIPTLFCLFTIFLVVFSNDNLLASKKGLNLWANSVVPSLFPFFIATELLSSTNIIFHLGNALNHIMRPLFNVPGEGSFALIMGIISGYPTGAKIVSNFKKDKICTNEECERLIAFTNNSGPLFIVGTVGTSLLCDTKTGFLLLFTHILACLTVGFIFRFWKKDKTKDIRSLEYSKRKNIELSNLGQIISDSIYSATKTIFMIGGFVVLFSIITSMLNNSHFFEMASYLVSPLFNAFGVDNKFINGFLSGFIEITNGIQQICSIPSKNFSIIVILISFLLGFGGISVLLQVLSITSKNNISIKPYIIGKLLHGIIAATYTFLILANTSMFDLNLV